MNAEFFHQLIESRDAATLQWALPGASFDAHGRVVINSRGKTATGQVVQSGVVSRDPGTILRWWLKQRK
jgi:hypothetical protein